MKTLLVLAVLVLSLPAAAQNDSLQPKQEAFVKERSIRFGYILPVGVGNNLLSEAGAGVGGTGVKMSFFSIYKIHVGHGIETVFYNGRNHRLAPGLSGINITTFTFEPMYQIDVTEKLRLYPRASIGYSLLLFRERRDNGSRDGARYAAGILADYKIGDHTGVYLSVDYSLTNVEVKTHPDYHDFFNHLTQLNAGVGLRFDFDLD